MTERGGSLGRGRRRPDAVPPVPDTRGLSATQKLAQVALRELVEAAGGRFARANVPVGRLEVLTELFEEWGRRHGEPTEYGVYFSGRPGLWHALDDLYPLQDPNRWDRLRRAVIAELERRNWRRRSLPRGSAFEIMS